MNTSLNVTLKATLSLALMTLLLTTTAPATAAIAPQTVTLQEPAPTADEDGKDDGGATIDTVICRLMGSCVDG